jgi:hypothetical protein
MEVIHNSKLRPSFISIRLVKLRKTPSSGSPAGTAALVRERKEQLEAADEGVP